MNYRTIYKQTYGPIPKDATTRSYDVHHWDGNKTNNDPINLVAVPIGIHFVLHYLRGDWGACSAIAARMKISPEEQAEMSRKTNLGKIRSPETKAKISAYWTGKPKGPMSEEQKALRRTRIMSEEEKIRRRHPRGPQKNSYGPRPWMKGNQLWKKRKSLSII